MVHRGSKAHRVQQGWRVRRGTKALEAKGGHGVNLVRRVYLGRRANLGHKVSLVRRVRLEPMARLAMTASQRAYQPIPSVMTPMDLHLKSGKIG